MRRLSRTARILIWVLMPILGGVAGAFLGALVGSVVGERMGSAEGEGFIGFIYGLWSGGALGVIGGAVIAWIIDRRQCAERAVPGIREPIG